MEHANFRNKRCVIGTTLEDQTVLDIAFQTSRRPEQAATFNFASQAHNNHFFFEALVYLFSFIFLLTTLLSTLSYRCPNALFSNLAITNSPIYRPINSSLLPKSSSRKLSTRATIHLMFLGPRLLLQPWPSSAPELSGLS